MSTWIVGTETLVIVLFCICFWWQWRRAKTFALADQRFAEAMKALFRGEHEEYRDSIDSLLRSLGNDAGIYRSRRPVLQVILDILKVFPMYEEATRQYGQGEFLAAMNLFKEADYLAGRGHEKEQITWPGKGIARAVVFIRGTKEFCRVASENFQFYDREAVERLIDQLLLIRRCAITARIDLPTEEYGHLWDRAQFARIQFHFTDVQCRFSDEDVRTRVCLSDILNELEIIRQDAVEHDVSLPDGFDHLVREVRWALASMEEAEAA